MITVREIVFDILKSDYVAMRAAEKGLINLSEYSRHIKPEVELRTKKAVSSQSIVVTLSRIIKEISNPILPDAPIEQLTVQSPVTQIIYPKSDTTLHELLVAVNYLKINEHSFFSFSTSTKDIAIVASESAVQTVLENFSVVPTLQKKDLAAISIRFPATGVAESNIGFSILSKLAARNIPLDAALTTYNEFTLVMEIKHLEIAVSSLSPRTRSD